MIIKKCFFTGHRGKYYLWKYNEEDPRCKKLKRLLKIQIEKAILQGFNYFYQGMALQGDTWFAEEVLLLKKKYPYIKIEAAIPCKNQDKKWIDKDKIRYRNLLKKMDNVHMCSEEEYNYKLTQMIDRDHYMINQGCTLGISICNGQPSGTKKTLDYALSKGIDTIVINPNSLKITPNKKELRVLECSTKGDRRYSAFYAKVKVFGVKKSIEEHYQLSKVLKNNISVSLMEDIKGKKPIYFKIKNIRYDIKYLSAWYKLLWVKYLVQHNELIQKAMLFDEYKDMFKGKNVVNCQADIIRQFIQEGKESIMENNDVVELIKLIESNCKNLK